MEIEENHPSENPEKKESSNRFSKRPWLAGIIVTVFLLLVLEGLSQLALLYRDKVIANQELSPEELNIQQLQDRDSVDREIMTKEMKYLYQEGIEFHPYRWYRLPGNFKGQYIETDALGYRFRQSEADTSKKLLACYGCSTMFSIYTKQDGTIPDILNSDQILPEGVQALNMGVGAYGTSTELTAFIETSRKYPLKYALFLDGVNEVARYLERFMYHKDEEFYDYWVYPYPSALQLAFMNTLNSRASEYKMEKKSSWKPALYWVSVSIAGKIRNMLKLSSSTSAGPGGEAGGWKDSDYEEAGRIAANLYIENIRDIDAIAKSRGIQAFFIIQPSLFTTKRELSEVEKSLRDNNDPFLAAIHESTYRHIREADKTGLHFIDLSDAWDDLPPGEYFYDWHHVNKAGNRHLARKIAEKMNLLGDFK
jgi:hypothetical protein